MTHMTSHRPIRGSRAGNVRNLTPPWSKKRYWLTSSRTIGVQQRKLPVNLNKIDASVDFLKCHGATRSADRGQWFTESGDPLESCPVESARQLRRALHRRDMEVNRIRTAVTGCIEL